MDLKPFQISCCLCKIIIVDAIGQLKEQSYVVALCKGCKEIKDIYMIPNTKTLEIESQLSTLYI